MKKVTTHQVKNVTVNIINYFLGLSESYVSAFNRKEFYRLLRGYSKENSLTCSNIAQLIYNLKKRGYIEIQKIDGNESILFTNKAQLAVVDKLSQKNLQDGKFRFVSFDIPELKRINRDQFRRAIKRMGFVQIQKSLWATNLNVGNFVEVAAKEYNVNEYIVYMVTEVTNIDVYLKQLLTESPADAVII